LRSRKRQVLVVTVGLTQFPRDELEAVCAHEMAHLHAVDAQWVTAAGSSVQRARRYATVVGTLGALMIGGLLYASATWVSGYAIGIALAIVGFVTAALLGRTTRRIRSEADDVADVAAVHLAKNPYALGQALDRVGADARRVTHNSWRSELLWFETTEEDGGLDAFNRGVREVNRRAEAAYATARRERPDAPAPA
jgi:Zn-dependent protease with chaperone function